MFSAPATNIQEVEPPLLCDCQSMTSIASSRAMSTARYSCPVRASAMARLRATWQLAKTLVDGGNGRLVGSDLRRLGRFLLWWLFNLSLLFPNLSLLLLDLLLTAPAFPAAPPLLQLEFRWPFAGWNPRTLRCRRPAGFAGCSFVVPGRRGPEPAQSSPTVSCRHGRCLQLPPPAYSPLTQRLHFPSQSGA